MVCTASEWDSDLVQCYEYVRYSITHCDGINELRLLQNCWVGLTGKAVDGSTVEANRFLCLIKK